MQPIVDGLEREFGAQVQFQRLDANIPPNGDRQTELGLRGHPAIAILDDSGRVTARYFGPEEADTLRTAILAVCAACPVE